MSALDIASRVFIATAIALALVWMNGCSNYEPVSYMDAEYSKIACRQLGSSLDTVSVTSLTNLRIQVRARCANGTLIIYTSAQSKAP